MSTKENPAPRANAESRGNAKSSEAKIEDRLTPGKPALLAPVLGALANSGKAFANGGLSTSPKSIG